MELTNHKTPWDQFEDDIIMTDYEEGVPMRVTAEKLGRTLRSVEWRRRILLKTDETGLTYYYRYNNGIE